MGDAQERNDDEAQAVGEPLETEDGVRVPAQQNVGPGVEEGGGEWPDPNTPPTLPAPGAAEDDADEGD
jgi:hypothetical protein